MANATFTYSASISGTNSFAWSSPSNWIVNGVPDRPIPGGANVTIPLGPGQVSYDDIRNLSITVSTIGNAASAPTLEIAPGSTLYAGSQGTTNYGTVNLDQTAEFLGPNFTNLGLVDVAANSVFETKNLVGTGTFDFLGGGADLFLSAPPVFGSTNISVTNFGGGDEILMGGNAFTNAANQYSGGYDATLTGSTLDVFGIRSSGAKTLIYAFNNFGTAAGTAGIGANVVTVTDPLHIHSKYLELDALCFLEGTQIAAEQGSIAIEALKTGDQVWTAANGARELKSVRWLGQRQIDLSRHPFPEGLYPVRIRSGALSDGLPKRDLLVSPNHCLLIEGELVPAKLLINGMTVVQDYSVSMIRYFHIELDCHDAVLAEGVAAETYIDTGNRGFFANAPVSDLVPMLQTEDELLPWRSRLCAPLRLRAEEVDPIWQQLSARAENLGYAKEAPRVTSDPDLRILVNGHESRPLAQTGDRYTFVVPAGTKSVRILSRSGMPTDINRHSNDWRRIGVALGQIVLRNGSQVREIPSDHPSLADGWHRAERTSKAMWRWTNGNAELALPTMNLAGGTTLELHLGGHTTYLVNSGEPERLAA